MLDEVPAESEGVFAADAEMTEMPVSSVEEPAPEISAQPIPASSEGAADEAGLTVEMQRPAGQAPESPPLATWAGEEAPGVLAQERRYTLGEWGVSAQ